MLKGKLKLSLLAASVLAGSIMTAQAAVQVISSHSLQWTRGTNPFPAAARVAMIEGTAGQGAYIARLKLPPRSDLPMSLTDRTYIYVVSGNLYVKEDPSQKKETKVSPGSLLVLSQANSNTIFTRKAPAEILVFANRGMSGSATGTMQDSTGGSVTGGSMNTDQTTVNSTTTPSSPSQTTYPTTPGSTAPGMAPGTTDTTTSPSSTTAPTTTITPSGTPSPSSPTVPTEPSSATPGSTSESNPAGSPNPTTSPSGSTTTPSSSTGTGTGTSGSSSGSGY